MRIDDEYYGKIWITKERVLDDETYDTVISFLPKFDNPGVKRCRVCLRGKFGVSDKWICGRHLERCVEE